MTNTTNSPEATGLVKVRLGIDEMYPVVYVSTVGTHDAEYEIDAVTLRKFREAEKRYLALHESILHSMREQDEARRQ